MGLPRRPERTRWDRPCCRTLRLWTPPPTDPPGRPRGEEGGGSGDVKLYVIRATRRQISCENGYMGVFLARGSRGGEEMLRAVQSQGAPTERRAAAQLARRRGRGRARQSTIQRQIAFDAASTRNTRAGEHTSVVPGCWAGSAVSAALLDTAAVDATTDPPSWAGRVVAAAWLAVEEVSAAAFILKCNCLKFRFGSAKVLVPSSKTARVFSTPSSSWLQVL